MNGHSRAGSRRSFVGVLALAVVLVLTLVLALLVTGCGSGSTATTASGGGATTTATNSTGGSVIQVIMTNRSYDPATVTVKVGDTVTWLNQDQPQHDVVADNGEFKSQLFDLGQSFSFTFTQAGTYPYHCSIHPGMVGTVIVQ
jgi:plastocyanin